MGLFDFLKPKWQSRNPEVRLAAVHALGAKDLDTLKALAAGDPDPRVQLAAAERIDDRRALEELVAGALGPEVFGAVRARVDRLMCEEALGGAVPPGLEDALARVEDLGLVERLATRAPTPALRVLAVERLRDPEALCRVLETNCGKEPARIALAGIEDEPRLARLVRTGANKVTRRLAEEKLAALAAERTGPAEAARREPEPEGLAEDPGEAVCPRVEEEPPEVARAAEESREAAAALAAQEAIAEERRHLAELVAELDRLGAAGARQEPEPSLRSLAELDRHARAAAFRHLDPAPFLARVAALRQDLDQQAAARAEADAQARRETLARRAELCAELEALAEAEDRAAAGRRVKELRREWKALPASPEPEARDLGERFTAAAERFAVRQAAFHEQLDWLRWNNKTLQEELCAVVEALGDDEPPEALLAQVKEAQRRWKAIGAAPRADAEALWQRFKGACDAVFERCRPFLEEQEHRRAEAAEHREELCRQAEVHADSTDWRGSAEALKRLQAEWKEAGALPRERDQELYTRFRKACDRFFERREAHLAELDEGRRGSQAEKERLCEQAETLAAEPDPAHARAFRELQADWKRAGPAPRDAEQPLWERFRAACDRYFAGLDASRRENLRQKQALCEEVEAFMAGLAADVDPGEVTARVVEFQKRWNGIGPVPREEDDATWERFHRPVDAFFEARRAPSPEAADLPA